MKIGNRSVKKIASSVFQKRHWRAFVNMMTVYKNFPSMFTRYFFATGNYPYEAKLKTKQNKRIVGVTTYCHDDILTVNEIFCRKDYETNRQAKIIVDIGSNIGISALYFLTRNDYSYCYLYEPVPQNIDKLKGNLRDFENRYCLGEFAVSDENAILEFGIEDTGRYGGIGVLTGKNIEVKCVHINDILADIFEKHEYIDVLKVDTEGAEIKTVLAIESEYLYKIRAIYVEAYLDEPLLPPDLFTQTQYGGVCRLHNKNRL